MTFLTMALIVHAADRSTGPRRSSAERRRPEPPGRPLMHPHDSARDPALAGSGR
jgi:hypothetical protein